MRFVAAVLVVVTHSTLYAHDRLSPDIEVWRFGEIGVPLFFGISGLVMIVSTANRTSRPGFWRDFATRRIIRIAPTYWLATTVKLLTLIAVPGVVVHSVLDWSNVFWSYLFLPSRRPDGAIEPLLGVGWTLIFEMGFYALFTLALALRVRPLPWVGSVLAILAIGSTQTGPDSPVFAYYFHPVVLYFLAGMVLGSFVVDGNLRALLRRIAITIALAALVAALAAKEGEWFVPVLFFEFVLVLAVLALVVLTDRWWGHKVPRPLLALGDSSYTMYLFHPLIAPIVPIVLSRLGIISAPVSVVTSVVLVVASTWVLYLMGEKPMTERLMAVYRRRQDGSEVKRPNA